MAYDAAPNEKTKKHNGDKDRQHMRAKMLRLRAMRAFDARSLYLTYCQSISEIIYPERADFTVKYAEYEERYDGLITTEPALLRRNMGNRLGAMMRPRGQDWFKLQPGTESLKEDHEVKLWCENATKTMRKILYDRRTNYTKAMAESDQDYVAYGNSVVAHTYNRDHTAVLFSCLHLRDCAWEKNADGQHDTMFRKMEKPIRVWKQLFGKENMPAEWRKLIDQNLEETKKTIYQVVKPEGDEPEMDARPAFGPSIKFSVTYITVDDEPDCCLAELGFKSFPFTVREWMTVSGEDYARSPCTSLALADSRTLNVAEEALLTSIERAARPPKWAVAGSFLDEQIRLGGDSVTWVDDEWDVSKGDPIKNLEVGDPRYAVEFNDRMGARLHRIFFEDLLELPDREMTAYEVGERLEMYIREGAPIFEPMEVENAQMLDSVFERAWDKGAFGPWVMDEGGMTVAGLPDALRNKKTEFEFETPLSKARAKLAAAQFDQLSERAIALIGTQDPRMASAIDNIDMDAALRDAMDGIAPAKWQRDPQQVEKMRAQQAQEAADEENRAMALQAGTELLNANPENLKRAEEAITGEKPT